MVIAALGGPSDLVDRPAAHLPTAPIVRAVPLARATFVTEASAVRAAAVVQGAVAIAAAPPPERTLIRERIDAA